MSRPGWVDKRGSNKARKVRRAWLLLTFDPDLGPDRARCHLKLSAWCEQVVDTVTLSVDRIELGGSYRRGNIQPACKPCQDRQGGLTALPRGRNARRPFKGARSTIRCLGSLSKSPS